jgi:hypothetical protein
MPSGAKGARRGGGNVPILDAMSYTYDNKDSR